MKINTRTSIKQLAGEDAACQVHVITRCSLNARMLKSTGSSVAVYMELFSGPSVIRNPGWSIQFGPTIDQYFPLKILQYIIIIIIIIIIIYLLTYLLHGAESFLRS
jgi:hypothetical protein